MAMNPRLLRPTANDSPASIPGLALWLDAAAADALYTTDAGPVTAASSPLDISGCVGWWDASDASTLTLDGSGNVEVWADKSGQDNDLSQATAANRPSVTASAVNGLPAVTFDGVNDTLRTGAISLTQPFQYYLVFRFESAYTSGAPRIIDAGTQPSPGRGGEFFRQNTDDVRLFGGSTVTAGSVPAGQLEQFDLWSLSFGGASDSFIRYRGGEYQVSTTAGTLDGSRITVGGDSNATAASHSNISVAELVLVSGALSAAERASLERYFAIKYGIANVHAPAVTASDPVGYWRDRSGNGRHATQSTAASRPVVGSQNGRKALTFDGSNDNLFVEDYAVESNLPGLTRFLVFEAAVASQIFATTTTAAKNAAAGGSTWWQRFGANWYGYCGDGIRYHGGTADTAAHVATNFFDGSLAATFGVRLQNSIDGVLLPVVGSLGTLVATTSGSSAKLAVGSNAGVNNFVDGRLCELLCYTRALTAAERRKVEVYLARRWGITLAPQVSNAEAQDWISRVYANGGTVSTSTASAVSTFCDAIESAGIRDRFYRLGIFAGSNLNAALVPLYLTPDSTVRNLFQFGTDMTNAAWLGGGNGPWTRTATSEVGPLGYGTATKCTTPLGPFSVRQMYQLLPVQNRQVTFSVYLKTNTGTKDVQWMINGEYLDTFTVTSTWTRYTKTYTSTISANDGRTALVTVDELNDAGHILAWGMQCEYGATATDYTQPRYGNATDTNNAFVGVGTDYAETGASGGLTGNGTSKYLNTGLAISDLPDQRYGHMAAYNVNFPEIHTASRWVIGMSNAAGTVSNWLNVHSAPQSPTSQYRRVNWSKGGVVVTNTSETGDVLFAVSRTAAGEDFAYQNAEKTALAAGPVSTAVTEPLLVFALNSAGTPNSYYDRAVAAYSIGNGLTEAEMTTYRSVLASFMSSLSRVST